MTSTKCLLCPDSNSIKEKSEVAVLKCSHSICWLHLRDYLKKNLNSKIKCPIQNCQTFISDVNIRKALSPEDTEKYENLGLSQLENFHKCLLPDCDGSIIYSDQNIQYGCPKCTLYNCILCKAAHNFLTCEQYQMSPERGKINCEAELRRAKDIFDREKRRQMRQAFLESEYVDLLLNDEVFECVLCNMVIRKGEGVKLMQCFHMFCRNCLKLHINQSNKVPVNCPSDYCSSNIEDRELQKILNQQELGTYETKCQTKVKSSLDKHLQCQAANCSAFFTYTKRPNYFICTKCGSKNCVKCNTVHAFLETCESYQSKKNQDPTLIALEEKIKAGKLMRCPDCSAILEKISGCNWIQCNNCNVELCWIRQMHRWGPKGSGDTSGGCQCGVKGPCDPKCNGCIPHRPSLLTSSRRAGRLVVGSL